MERNYLQPNHTYTASFAPNTAAANQQPEAQPQARPVPPLTDAADLSHNPAAKNLQAYNTISTPQGPVDNWNTPEYQPIKPGEPYMEKQKPEDQAENTRRMERSLKHAQDCEADGDFQDAEEAYEKALKYTKNPGHYKLYAGCLQKISASLKDATKASVYKDKAVRAFYYLGNLYQKQGALQEAQAAYKAACDLALYEAPLQALVDVTRQLGDTAEIANALEKLADFYAEQGAIALAIDKLNEAFEVLKSPKILEKLEALYRQVGGEDSQLKVNETRIHQFELQISQDPKNIGLYRQYVWFLKDVGKRNEARAVQERMDTQLQAIQRALFQDLQENLQALQQKAQTLEQKVGKQKTKIGGLKQTIQSQAETIHNLQESVQANATKNETAHTALQTRVASFETVQLPEQLNRLNALNTQFETLKGQVQANAAKNDTAHTALQTRVVSLETVKLPEQVNKLNTLNTQFETLKGQVQANATKNETAHTTLQTRVASFENVKLPEQINRLNTLNAQLETLKGQVQANAAKNETAHTTLQTRVVSLETVKLPEQVNKLNTLNTQLEALKGQVQVNATGTHAAIEALKKKLEFSNFTSLSLNNVCRYPEYEPRDQDIIPLLNTNPCLKYLSFQMCRHLTDEVLRIIPDRFQNLEYLNVVNCSKMTLVGLSAMVDRLPRLKRLSYWGLIDIGQEHQALIQKLNARGIVHAGLNWETR